MTHVLAEVRGIPWGFILFSETRMKSGQQILDGGHKLYSSLDDNQFAGVAILVNAKHVKKNIKLHVISGRVLALDVCINGLKIRVVAVYLPHCGYDVEDFDQTFDQLRCVVDQGQKQKRKIIIGGDFNSQVNVGYRGTQLQSLVDSFALTITNNLDIPWEMQWTFESSMGIKRKIDFVLISRSFELISGHASNEINLGSDHRSVKSVVRIQGASRKRGKFAATLKNWKPVLGETGRAENFEVALLHQLQTADNESIAKLEKVLYAVGITEGVQVKVLEKSKPWQSDGIKGLIQERKSANTAAERRRISKLIQKSTRKALRKCGDEKTTDILNDFVDL